MASQHGEPEALRNLPGLDRLSRVWAPSSSTTGGCDAPPGLQRHDFKRVTTRQQGSPSGSSPSGRSPAGQ